jgi:hypothetical protein
MNRHSVHKGQSTSRLDGFDKRRPRLTAVALAARWVEALRALTGGNTA